ncbi:hypothetical protein WAI453_011012 [Rhynchosporium graminicola]
MMKIGSAKALDDDAPFQEFQDCHGHNMHLLTIGTCLHQTKPHPVLGTSTFRKFGKLAPIRASQQSSTRFVIAVKMPLFQKIMGAAKSVASTASPVSESTGPTMDIQLQNRTKSNTVYAYITGLAVDKGNQVCVMKADGKTPYYPSSPNEILQPLSENCSIKLGAPGSTITVTIPQLAGGRIWFAIDNELKFIVNPGPALVEPSISNPSDPNINLTWDFCEFTFANNSIYANISYVDFVSLSVSLTFQPKDGAEQKVLGLKPDGFQHVVDGLKAQDNKDWSKLVYEANGKPLRVMSPNNGIVMAGGNLFKGYYEPYVDQVYDKYTNCCIEIDTHAQWGKVKGKCNSGKLEFSGAGSFTKPSTADIFGCSSGPFAKNAGALGPLTARITAGFNRTTLLNEQIHPNAEKVDEFYKLPVTNHYARLCHEANIDGRGYAFPYDDVPAGGGGVDQSGFVSGDPKSLIVAVGCE